MSCNKNQVTSSYKQKNLFTFNLLVTLTTKWCYCINKIFHLWTSWTTEMLQQWRASKHSWVLLLGSDYWHLQCSHTSLVRLTRIILLYFIWKLARCRKWHSNASLKNWKPHLRYDWFLSPTRHRRGCIDGKYTAEELLGVLPDALQRSPSDSTATYQ